MHDVTSIHVWNSYDQKDPQSYFISILVAIEAPVNAIKMEKSFEIALLFLRERMQRYIRHICGYIGEVYNLGVAEVCLNPIGNSRIERDREKEAKSASPTPLMSTLCLVLSLHTVCVLT